MDFAKRAGSAAAVLLMAVPLYAAELPKPLAGHPGNVFLEGEEVAVKLPAVKEGESWVCVDYEGREVLKGTGGEAKAGKLPVGYYEIWKTGEEGKRSERVTLGVLTPLKAATPEDSPIALDMAASWFFRKEDAPFAQKEAANLTALAGVKWVRDRLAWGETEPEKGRFVEETIYDRTAAAFSAEGLKVLQVFHSTPKWAGERPKFFPDDYRDAYRYLKTMSARWKGKVEAWEPWNEGDTTHFGGHTGDQMMSYQKAAALGIRAGNPEAIVGQNVFAQHQMTGVLENFIENLDPAAFDTFNFHHYVQGGAIPKSYADMRKADGGKPIWVTESYFHFRQGVKTGDLDMTPEQRKLRARFVTTNLVTALNEGPEQFFTFLLPHYVEAGVLFGLLNEDGTPRPDYLALAAAGRLLVGAEPLGKLKSVPAGYAFRAKPDGVEKTVVVAWAEKEMALPQEIAGGEGYDFLGRKMDGGTLGTEPVYRVLGEGVALDLEASPKEKPVAGKGELSPLVIQAVFPPERLRLASSSWEVRQGEKAEVPLRVYLFGKEAAKVSLEVEADPALVVSLKETSFTLEPEGRGDGGLEIGWSGKTVPARPLLVKVTAKADGVPPSVSVLRISTQMAEVKPRESWPVTAANDPGKWKAGSSAGEVKISGTEGVDVDADLKPGDRWVYPWFTLDKGQKPTEEADGIAFTLTPQEGTAAYHVMLREPGGALYVGSLGNITGDGKPRRMVMLFSEFTWAGYSPVDGNHRLDAGEAEAFAIGGNPTDARFRYRVEDASWVDFAE